MKEGVRQVLGRDANTGIFAPKAARSKSESVSVDHSGSRPTFDKVSEGGREGDGERTLTAGLREEKISGRQRRRPIHIVRLLCRCGKIRCHTSHSAL